MAANVVCWAGVVWRREERRDLEWDLMGKSSRFWLGARWERADMVHIMYVVVSVNMLMVVLAGFLLKVERLVGRG